MTVTGNAIIAEAQKLGQSASYVFGGTGPAGYDCSGLVQATLEKLGITNVPRTSEAQYAWATPIQASDLEPGDLVFAQFPGDGTSPGHVGVYAGNGEVYSAQDPSAGIGMSSLASWKGSIVGYGAAPGTSQGTSSGNTITGIQGNIPGVSAPGYVPSGAVSITPGGQQTTPATPGSLGVPSILSGVGGLLYDVANALDYFFGMFGRGQGWRIVFSGISIASLFLAYKALVGAGAIPSGLMPSAVPV
jgi:hypothetical protein